MGNYSPFPLIILGAGGVLMAASVSSGGFFLNQSIFIFIYGIIASIARQYVKDKQYEEHAKIYALSQFGLFASAVILFFFLFFFLKQ